MLSERPGKSSLHVALWPTARKLHELAPLSALDLQTEEKSLGMIACIKQVF